MQQLFPRLLYSCLVTLTGLSSWQRGCQPPMSGGRSKLCTRSQLLEFLRICRVIILTQTGVTFYSMTLLDTSDKGCGFEVLTTKARDLSTRIVSFLSATMTRTTTPAPRRTTAGWPGAPPSLTSSTTTSRATGETVSQKSWS